MGTVKRSIKFCYYKVAQVDAKGKIIDKYNLTEWLSKMTSKALFPKKHTTL